MKCPNCRCEVQSNYSNCPYCGYDLFSGRDFRDPYTYASSRYKQEAAYDGGKTAVNLQYRELMCDNCPTIEKYKGMVRVSLMVGAMSVGIQLITFIMLIMLLLYK